MGKIKQKALTEFNIRIKDARKHAKLTQEQLANAVAKMGAPCTQGAIDKLENRSALTSTVTVQIAAACNISPYWLASGEGEMVTKDLPNEAMAIGAAWQHFRPQLSQDRITHELLGVALPFMHPAHPWYKTAARLYRESSKRRGVRAELKQGVV